MVKQQPSGWTERRFGGRRKFDLLFVIEMLPWYLTGARKFCQDLIQKPWIKKVIEHDVRKRLGARVL
jgi:hypothetical protein